jgi:aspartate 1-decarboxylase
MKRKILRAKVHRATVTEVDKDYEGSLGVDAGILEAARLVPFEYVEVYNITNGNRFQTYVIPLPPGCRRLAVYGAAAHLAHPGDRIILAAYASLDEDEIATHRPVILQMDEENRFRDPEAKPPVTSSVT